MTLAVGGKLTDLFSLFLVQVECNSKLDPTKTTLLKVQAEGCEFAFVSFSETPSSLQNGVVPN